LHSIHACCCRLRGIGAEAAAGAFEEAEIDVSTLPHLNEHDLQVTTRMVGGSAAALH
jgi:hypothetical protein